MHLIQRTLLIALAALPAANRADEGMWLYNHPPRQLLRERHGFEVTDAWLRNLQRASVRFNSGGSGSFVSEDGLVLSNHHVGSDAIAKLSTRERDLLRDGFYARAMAEEMPCQGLELNVLMDIEDVTARVNAAVPAGLGDEQAFRARRAAIVAIEKESLDQTGLRSDVVTLYQGGQYHLYRFKKYTDVRLVFAPEQQIAFFGGDPDNFEYPRFDLDICLFRVYENGAPVKIPHYLKWSAAGAMENELVFVSGHPGRTERLRTVAELEFRRDVQLPYTLNYLKSREVLLTAWSARSAENARRAKDDLFGIQNGRKSYDGDMAGLLDPQIMAAKRAAEQRLRAAVNERAELKDVAGAWDRIAQAQKVMGEHFVAHSLLERSHGFGCQLFSYARQLVRSAEERAKPNAERLKEYSDADRESFELHLFAAEPIYSDLETIKLADSLIWLANRLGSEHPVVKKALAGQSPRERAAALVAGCRLADPAVRRQLYEGGQAALDAANDPMIALARAVDAEARAVRQIFETQGEAIRQAHAQIGRARYAVDGDRTHPDATFTLRLAFGLVKGYTEAGRAVPFQTTYAGLYERAGEQLYRPPFDLPARWLDRRKKLDLSVPFNFVCTADIVGGNSGSPVVNRAGEFVGIIFDGNIQSLVCDVFYTEEQGRAVSVHSRAIIEALVKIYDAKPLADELLGRRRPR